jgi:hypothetical protein
MAKARDGFAILWAAISIRSGLPAHWRNWSASCNPAGFRVIESHARHPLSHEIAVDRIYLQAERVKLLF